MVISSLLCVISTCICIYEDWPNANVYGYLFVIILNFTSVIFLEYSKYLLSEIDINRIEMLSYIGFNAMIINIIVILVNGDLSKAIDCLQDQYSSDRSKFIITIVYLVLYMISELMRQFLSLCCSSYIDVYLTSISMAF